MKNLLRINFCYLLLLISCKDEKKLEFPVTSFDVEIEMQKVDSLYLDFENDLNDLYSQSEKQPKKILVKIDSLLSINEKENDKYKSQLKINIAEDLRYFKAELLYNNRQYLKSIYELKLGTSGSDEIGLICNYLKLKDFDKAKRILDSIPKYNSFNTFIYGNFYESIGNKSEALKKYNSIKKNKGNVRFSYYTKVIQRIKELEKKNSNLLNGAFWQTGTPRLKYQN